MLFEYGLKLDLREIIVWFWIYLNHLFPPPLYLRPSLSTLFNNWLNLMNNLRYEWVYLNWTSSDAIKRHFIFPQSLRIISTFLKPFLAAFGTSTPISHSFFTFQTYSMAKFERFISFFYYLYSFNCLWKLLKYINHLLGFTYKLPFHSILKHNSENL